MDPITATIILGGIAYMQKMQADRQEKAIREAQKAEEQNAANKQNALVRDSYGKRRDTMSSMRGGRAVGLGGAGASQTGTILTSVTGEASILG